MPRFLWRKWSLSHSLVFSHFPCCTLSAPLTYLHPPPLPNHLQLYLYCNCLGKQHHFGTEAALIACVWDALRVAMQTLWVCVCLLVWRRLSGVRHTAPPPYAPIFFYFWSILLLRYDWLKFNFSFCCRFKDVTEMQHFKLHLEPAVVTDLFS